MGDVPLQKWEHLEETALSGMSGVYLRLLNRQGDRRGIRGYRKGERARATQACWQVLTVKIADEYKVQGKREFILCRAAMWGQPGRSIPNSKPMPNASRRTLVAQQHLFR